VTGHDQPGAGATARRKGAPAPGTRRRGTPGWLPRRARKGYRLADLLGLPRVLPLSVRSAL